MLLFFHLLKKNPYIVGEELNEQERLDYNQACQERQIEVANEIEQNIRANWKNSTALEVNSQLRDLRMLDPDKAARLEAKFRGIREGEVYGKQLAIDSGLRVAELKQGKEVGVKKVGLVVVLSEDVSDELRAEMENNNLKVQDVSESKYRDTHRELMETALTISVGGGVMTGGAKFLAKSRIIQSAATKYKNIGSGIKQAYNISKNTIQKAHQSINNVIIQHPDKVQGGLDMFSGLVLPPSPPRSNLEGVIAIGKKWYDEKFGK